MFLLSPAAGQRRVYRRLAVVGKTRWFGGKPDAYSQIARNGQLSILQHVSESRSVVLLTEQLVIITRTGLGNLFV